MSKYIVRVNERHASSMLIEAKSVDDAVDRVKQGEGEELCCDYVETYDIDSDEVDLVDDESVIFGDEENHDPQE